jgi:hypothetical protein
MEFFAANEVTGSVCTYCSAVDAYGIIYLADFEVAEGEPNGAFLQNVCGYRCA